MRKFFENKKTFRFKKRDERRDNIDGKTGFLLTFPKSIDRLRVNNQPSHLQSKRA